MNDELTNLLGEACENLRQSREQKDKAIRDSIEVEAICAVFRTLHENRTLLTNHGYTITITKDES